MSTTTKNVSLILPDNTDYIKLSDFTTNFQTIDSVLGADYILKQGTESVTTTLSDGTMTADWWYRIWKSGTKECGIYSHIFSGTYYFYDGGLMFHSPFSNGFGNYPSALKTNETDTTMFAHRPTVVINYLYDDNHDGESVNDFFPGLIYTRGQRDSDALKKTPGFGVFANTDTGDASNLINPKFCIYVTGV